MSLLIQLCDDYLHDRLDDAERKVFEERIAKGDKELIETLYQLKSFGKARILSEEDELETSENLVENEKAQLLSLVNKETYSPRSNAPKTDAPEKESLADALQELDKKRGKKAKTTFFSILGVLCIVLIGTIIFQQWSVFSLEREVDLLEKKLALQERELAELRIRSRDAVFNFNRMRNLVSGDFFTTNKIKLKNNRGSWIQLWDRGTLRTLVLLEKPVFEEGELIQLWSRNVRTREWQFVGSLDNITADSVYTQWDAQMLARSMGLQIKLVSKDKKDEIIGEITLN